ncbi:MAG: peptidoglycan bridge formation glycyltransferase FemA/FemB family protein [Armatimonadetes bacterium]|nr:peptidoglycan bridge formation glycyltransferase FemA/FemB family protein [Armatimonadota bacterium]
MLEIREAVPEDRNAWDFFVASQPGGHILQSYGWGELERYRGFETWRLIVSEGKQIVAIASILIRRWSFPKSAILYVPRGPVISGAREDALRGLLETIRHRARAEKAIFLKVDPFAPEGEASAESLLERSGFERAPLACTHLGTQPPVTIQVSLAPNLSEILDKMESKCRQYVRLAERQGIRIREGGTEDLPLFVDMLRETGERRGFSIPKAAFLQALWQELICRAGAGALFLAESQGKVTAGRIALALGETCWEFYAASMKIPRGLHPNHLLVWEIIKWGKKRGCVRFDMRGVPDDPPPRHPLYGIYRFKKGFGGDLVRFTGEWDLVFSRALYGVWQMALPHLGPFTRRSLAVSPE